MLDSEGGGYCWVYSQITITYLMRVFLQVTSCKSKVTLTTTSNFLVSGFFFIVFFMLNEVFPFLSLFSDFTAVSCFILFLVDAVVGTQCLKKIKQNTKAINYGCFYSVSLQHFIPRTKHR